MFSLDIDLLAFTSSSISSWYPEIFLDSELGIRTKNIDK